MESDAPCQILEGLEPQFAKMQAGEANNELQNPQHEVQLLNQYPKRLKPLNPRNTLNSKPKTPENPKLQTRKPQRPVSRSAFREQTAPPLRVL